jgi:predicted dehydrogenase
MGGSVAVIGLRHGERHVHGFLAAGADKVYAVDINKDLYEKVLHDRVVTADDYQQVIPLVDIIVISLPPALHQQALKAAIATNAKHIWVEKPLLDVGEDPQIFAPDDRVEVIHELRRNQVVRDWVANPSAAQEVWLSWHRPVPPQYNPERYPVGVIHDLGSHLIDLSFALLGRAHAPTLKDATLTSAASGVQKVDVTLNFGDVPVHLSAAWVDPKDWPEEEITVRMQTSAGEVSWSSRKSTHRHLTDGSQPSTQQMQEEKDWYTPALGDETTHFTPLDTAIKVQKICNDIVESLKKEKT